MIKNIQYNVNSKIIRERCLNNLNLKYIYYIQYTTKVASIIAINYVC